jgi:hypothetical protein
LPRSHRSTKQEFICFSSESIQPLNLVHYLFDLQTRYNHLLRHHFIILLCWCLARAATPPHSTLLLFSISGPIFCCWYSTGLSAGFRGGNLRHSGLSAFFCRSSSRTLQICYNLVRDGTNHTRSWMQVWSYHNRLESEVLTNVQQQSSQLSNTGIYLFCIVAHSCMWNSCWPNS